MVKPPLPASMFDPWPRIDGERLKASKGTPMRRGDFLPAAVQGA